MQRNPDKWIYTVECANPEGNEDLSKDYRFNKNGWRWSKGYDTVEAICNKYTRGEAVDMVFNKHYTFVKYLATQHLPWGDNTVSFMKETALERVVMNLDEIWDNSQKPQRMNARYAMVAVLSAFIAKLIWKQTNTAICQ